METINDAKAAIIAAWPEVKTECLAVLGSELHYQAMIYHHLRTYGKVPATQLGMNVKMYIQRPVSSLFKDLEQKKKENYREGFEPIPDVVIFSPSVRGDWRRRNNNSTLLNMLVAIEVKASERANGRLGLAEIKFDIEKLSAHREEVKARGTDMFPLMMVIDSAPKENERMTPSSLKSLTNLAYEFEVGFLYASPDREINSITL